MRRGHVARQLKRCLQRDPLTLLLLAEPNRPGVQAGAVCAELAELVDDDVGVFIGCARHAGFCWDRWGHRWGRPMQPRYRSGRTRLAAGDLLFLARAGTADQPGDLFAHVVAQGPTKPVLRVAEVAVQNWQQCVCLNGCVPRGLSNNHMRDSIQLHIILRH